MICNKNHHHHHQSVSNYLQKSIKEFFISFRISFFDFQTYRNAFTVLMSVECRRYTFTTKLCMKWFGWLSPAVRLSCMVFGLQFQQILITTFNWQHFSLGFDRNWFIAKFVKNFLMILKRIWAGPDLSQLHLNRL